MDNALPVLGFVVLVMFGIAMLVFHCPFLPKNCCAQNLDETVAPHSFKRIEKQSARMPPLIAAWKRKSMNMNRGIALVHFSDPSVHPGEFARAIKKTDGAGPLATVQSFMNSAFNGS